MNVSLLSLVRSLPPGRLARVQAPSRDAGERRLRTAGGSSGSGAGKVLLLSQFLPPETGAAANRIGAMARALSGRYQVLAVTLKPGYPSPELYEATPLESHDSGLPYRVRRAFDFHPHRGGLLVRALREQAMALRLAARAVSAPAEIVVASSPSMFLGPVGLALARAKGAKFVWDVRDITWSYARDVAGPSRVMSFGLRILERYMLSVLGRADLVVGATPGVTQVLIESGLDPEKALTVSNGISPDLLGVAQKSYESPAKRRPVVTYAGLFGRNHSLGVLLEAASLLPEVDFLLVGDGPELPALKRKARELGLENVSFRGYLVNKRDLLEVYEESDILFAGVKSTPVLDATAISFKLFEYMATGRPLVYAGRGVGAELLDQIGCAVTVSPEDPEAISAGISALLRDPRRMRTLGRAGRVFVEQNYRRDELMKEFVNELEERFSRKPESPQKSYGAGACPVGAGKKSTVE